MFIPKGQNFSCRRCGLLCRKLFIPVSPEEKEKIAGLVGNTPSFITRGKSIYLARTREGCCVFLDADNLCLIHKKWGAQAKPLACRVFPFQFSMRGPEIAVGVRFACPAVAANEGAPIERDRTALSRLASQASSRAGLLEESAMATWHGLPWEAVEGIVDILRETVESKMQRLNDRALTCLRLFDVVQMAEPEELMDPATLSRLRTLRDAILREEERRAPDSSGGAGPVRSLFCQLLAHYARRDEERVDSWSVKARLRRAFSLARLLAGKGSLSDLGADLPALGFRDLHAAARLPCEPEAQEPVVRFLRVKLETHQFYGPVHHGFDLDEGVLSLLAAYPVLAAFSRLFAAGKRAQSVTREDVVQGVSAVDHGFSTMQAFRSKGLKKIVRKLTREETYRSLVGLYGLHGAG